MKSLMAILMLVLCGGCFMSSPWLENRRPAKDPLMPYVPEPDSDEPEVEYESSVSSAVMPTPDPVTVEWTLSIPIEVVTSTDLSMWTVESNVVWEGTHATVLNPMTEEQRYWAVRLNGQIIRLDEGK